ncbi:MAG: sugar ABC transporter ATP-binding protein [Rhodobacteraceae bacterium]|nr:sugar ABC transporter ATP-binding protein [Paracoccaceae bacterium]
MTASPPAIHFEHITKTFGGVTALDDVSLTVLPGEVHCLAGENGCGKSTIIKIITGVYQPDAGAEMEIFGHKLSAITPTIARKLGIDVIWQDLALFPQMSVAENIAFEAVLGNVPRVVRHSKMRDKASEVLQRLGVNLDLEAPLHTLSVAERQIVAVGRALVGEAKLVFMDEPTASLTKSETDKLLNIVDKLSADGVAVVFVSHRLAEVLKISSRVTVLRDGKLVGVYGTEGMTQSRLTELMTGHTFDSVVAAQDRNDAPTVLEVKNLSRRGEFKNIDLTIRAGEIVGVTGLIGAGRTELGHALFGMSRPDSGEITINGAPVRFRSNRDAIACGVAYVSEDRLTLGLVQPQSIADNIVLPVLDKILDKLGLFSAAKKEKTVHAWINDLAVKIGHPDDPITTLSGGNQQRIVLAKWLATKPKLLILDSPTVGVDVGARAGIFEIVRKLASEGLAILMITDEIPEAYYNSDRVIHMSGGEFTGEYDPRTSTIHQIEEAVFA